MSEIYELKYSDIPKLRDQLKEEQNGLCPICGKELVREVLDHLHKKRIKGDGLIRGVLCAQCNVYLGLVENNSIRYGIAWSDLPYVLTNISIYLDKPRLPYLHPSEITKEPKLSKRVFAKLCKLHAELYPNKKMILYPKSGKVTKDIKVLLDILKQRESND